MTSATPSATPSAPASTTLREDGTVGTVGAVVVTGAGDRAVAAGGGHRPAEEQSEGDLMDLALTDISAFV